MLFYEKNISLKKSNCPTKLLNASALPQILVRVLSPDIDGFFVFNIRNLKESLDVDNFGSEIQLEVTLRFRNNYRFWAVVLSSKLYC